MTITVADGGIDSPQKDMDLCYLFFLVLYLLKNFGDPFVGSRGRSRWRYWSWYDQSQGIVRNGGTMAARIVAQGN